MERNLALLDQLIQHAEAGWVDEIIATADWPDDDQLIVVAGRKMSRLSLYDDYLYGDEARQIARIIFQLKAAPIDTAEKMESLIERHNESMQADFDDRDYPQRTGIDRNRVKQAQMITLPQREILVGAVLRHGPGVMHRSGYTRLLARHANQNRVNQTLDILCEAGFLRKTPGANNADLFISDGRLETAHRRYLEEIAHAAREIA